MEQLNYKYKTIFDKAGVEQINSVLSYATARHEGQNRNSGEPYITHPIAVANILLDLGLDVSTICAALLHDTIEDTPATEEEVTKLFGEEICSLVMGVTKLAKYTFASEQEEAAENFRRMYFAMAKDIRVILIKLADRLHNMRTIESKPQQRQIATAKETLEIYSPLASRLGLSYIKCELEDICFRVLEPQSYTALIEAIPLKRAEREDLISHLCLQLKNILSELKINGEVSGRPKHFYSIHKKMVRQNKTFDQIYDLTAVRVIVPSVKDCYEVLGMIHSLWKPIPGRFKDYISVPKANNYQSLHTTVMTTYGMPFEIQIRTLEMHKIAEYGVAAHWKYKENRSEEKSDLDKKIEWIREMADVQADSSPQEFYESLKLDLYSGQVFIFTPRGDVVALPEGSTAVDFAYSVHSQVGNKCVGAKVNNKITPLEKRLKTGDYVEIITSANSKGPSRDWLRFVKSTQAKSKIRAYFKKEMREDNIKKGHEMLEREAKLKGYNLPELMEKKWLDVIMERYSISSIDDLYAAVGYGGFTTNQILLKLIDFYKRQQGITQKQTKMAAKTSVGGGIIVMGQTDLLIRLARCCNPVPYDEIVGFISRGRGVAIHRKNCPNLKHIEPFRLAEAHWSDTEKASFVAELHVETTNTAGILASITTLISTLSLSIESLNARVDKRNNGIITLRVNVSDTNQVRILTEQLKSLPQIDKVYRSS